MKKIIKLLIAILLLLILFLVSLIIWLTISDFRPDSIEKAEIHNTSDKISSSTLSILNWNIGYGGLGEQMDFFMDGGTRVRAPEEEYTVYRNGIMEFLNSSHSQIYFIQEIDRKSTRSYKEDQFLSVSQLFKDYDSSFAPNYKVKFIPAPTIIGTQYGSVHSGLAIFSQFKIEESTRLSLPGNYSWPKRVFFLDRAMLVSKIKKDDGKTIVLINTHNSAYDKGGFLKKDQLDFLKKYAEEEYNQGHYVIIGGDWNNFMPGTNGETFSSEEKAPDYYQPLPVSWKMENWTWGSDDRTPTNRSLEAPFEPGYTFTSVIDGYLLSPNINVIDVETFNLGFKYSDHNPTKINVELR